MRTSMSWHGGDCQRDVAAPAAFRPARAVRSPGLAALAVLLALAASAPRLAAQTTVVSAASYQGTVAPGSLATIFGSNLAIETVAGSPGTDGSYPKQLSGTTVTVGGAAADLVFVSPTQINFVVPVASQSGSLGVVVASGAQTTATVTATVAPTAPAVFTSDGGGTGFGAILNAIDFTRPPFSLATATPGGGQATTIIAVYGTGFRFAGGMAAANQSGDVSSHVTAQVSNPGGTTWTLPVLYAGPAPGYEGLDQVNIQLASGLDTTSDLTLTLFADAVPSNTVYLWLRRMPGPTLTAVSPSSASPGATVAIAGGGFLDSNTLNAYSRQSVALVLSDGTRVPAPILSMTAQSIAVVVPAHTLTGTSGYYYGGAQLCVSVDSQQACLPGPFSVAHPAPTGLAVGQALMAYLNKAASDGLNALPITTDPGVVASIADASQAQLDRFQQLIAAATNGAPQSIQATDWNGNSMTVVMDLATIQQLEALLTASSTAGPGGAAARSDLQQTRLRRMAAGTAATGSFCQPTESQLLAAYTNYNQMENTRRTMSLVLLAPQVAALGDGCVAGLVACVGGPEGCLGGCLAGAFTEWAAEQTIALWAELAANIGTDLDRWLIQSSPVYLDTITASPAAVTLSYPASQTAQFQVLGHVAPNVTADGDLATFLAQEVAEKIVGPTLGASAAFQTIKQLANSIYQEFAAKLTSWIVGNVSRYLLSSGKYDLQNLTPCSATTVSLGSSSLSFSTFPQNPAFSVAPPTTDPGAWSLALNASTAVPAQSVSFYANKGNLLLTYPPTAPANHLSVFVSSQSPTLTTDKASCTLADSFSVTGSGFAPRSQLGLSLQGMGRSTSLTQSLTTSASGGFQQSVVLPAGTVAGSYQIVASSLESPLSASAGITVLASPTASFTMSSGGQTAPSGSALNLGVAQGGTVTVAFDGGASTAGSGSISNVSWSWQNNGAALPCSGSTCSVGFASGIPNNTIRLTVTNASGQQASATGQVNVSVQASPPGPLTLTLEAPVCDQAAPAGPAVRLDWTLSANASNYDVYRNGSLDSPSGVSVSGTTFNNNAGVVAGQTYSYFIRAKNIAGTRDSNTVGVSVPSNICQAAPTLQSVTIAPSSITAGSSATVTIALSGPAPSGGATVSLSTSSPAFPVPSSIPIAAGQSSGSFSVHSSASIAATTTATVTGNYNGVDQLASITISVGAALAPATPTGLSPGGASQPGTTVTTLTPTLSWNASQGATAYSVVVSQVGGGTVLSQNVSTNSVVCPTLVNGATYLWAVGASSSAGNSVPSAVVYFTVSVPTAPATPTGLSPGGSSQPGTTVNTLTPTLSWNASQGATAYSVVVSQVGGGTVLAQNVSTNSVACPTLVNGATYLWAVGASNSAGNSATSAVVYFTVKVAPAISGVSPNPVPKLNGYQTITISGSAFISGASVTLTSLGQSFPIPASRTTFVNTGDIQISVNVTTTVASWTAQVTNPGGLSSNVFTFPVN